MADQWIIGRLDILRSVAAAKSPIHVGLSATEPNIADQNILEVDFVRACYFHLDRLSRYREGGKRTAPSSIGSDLGFTGLIREMDAKFFIWGSPSPDHDRLIALNDHMIGKDCGDSDFCNSHVQTVSRIQKHEGAKSDGKGASASDLVFQRHRGGNRCDVRNNR